MVEQRIRKSQVKNLFRENTPGGEAARVVAKTISSRKTPINPPGAEWTTVNFPSARGRQIVVSKSEPSRESRSEREREATQQTFSPIRVIAESASSTTNDEEEEGGGREEAEIIEETEEIVEETYEDIESLGGETPFSETIRNAVREEALTPYSMIIGQSPGEISNETVRASIKHYLDEENDTGLKCNIQADMLSCAFKEDGTAMRTAKAIAGGKRDSHKVLNFATRPERVRLMTNLFGPLVARHIMSKGVNYYNDAERGLFSVDMSDLAEETPMDLSGGEDLYPFIIWGGDVRLPNNFNDFTRAISDVYNIEYDTVRNVNQMKQTLKGFVPNGEVGEALDNLGLVCSKIRERTNHTPESELGEAIQSTFGYDPESRSGHNLLFCTRKIMGEEPTLRENDGVEYFFAFERSGRDPLPDLPDNRVSIAKQSLFFPKRRDGFNPRE